METNNNIIGFKVSYHHWHFTRTGNTSVTSEDGHKFKIPHPLLGVYIAQRPIEFKAAFNYCQFTSAVRNFNFEIIYGPVKEKFSFSNWFKRLLTLKK